MQLTIIKIFFGLIFMDFSLSLTVIVTVNIRLKILVKEVHFTKQLSLRLPHVKVYLCPCPDCLDYRFMLL
jgi:hypothetical protein